MVWLTLVIGSLNICLGYGLAVYLGYGPPGLGEAWTALSSRPAPSPQISDALLDKSFDELVEAFSNDSVEDLLDETLEDDAEFEVQPSEEAYDDDVAEMLHPDAPEMWDLNEKFVETSLLKLNIAMMKSGARATQIDARLRACQGRTDQKTVRECWRQLKVDCESYLAEQAELADEFHERIDELGELSSIGNEIEMANLEQAAQIETTLSNLTHMDFDSDLEAANLRLLEEIGNLRFARHVLRDQQEAAFLAIARYEERLDKMEEALFRDPLTKLRNRIGLESTLCAWWEHDRHKSREMNAALFDLNRFGEVNKAHGSLLADRMLYEIACLLQESAAKADLVARYSGQQFILLLHDVGPRTAMKTVETIRQTIEKMTFVCGEDEVTLTASAGITSIKPEDTDEDMLKRMEAALKEAKAAGPNQAFFHDGKEITAVNSPNFGAKETVVTIPPDSLSIEALMGR